MPVHRIIFIDDDKVNNSLSRIIARQALGSFEVHTFEHASDALNFLNEEFSTQIGPLPESLILLDINMPVMSGWGFLEKLALAPEEIIACLRIYILSSSIDPRDKSRADQHPLVKGYISKPLASGILHDLVTDQNKISE